MSAKGFICEVDLNLHLLSTLGSHECPSHYVYLTIELFGKLHQTKPQHAYYPLVFNETINVEKTFWSPSSEDDVLNMLEDAPVVVELRRIDPCFYNGLLLGYYDGNAKDLLFSRYPRIPCSTNGREIHLNRTVDFKGTAPRVRYSSFADIKRLGGDFDDNNSGKLQSMYSRNDDGYYSPTQSVKETNYKSLSRQSRSPKRSYSPVQSENVSAPYYTRQTVSSAFRSRSPSPVFNRSGDNYEEKEYMATGDSGLGTEKSKEPFVVRKVPENLITRNPKLHDNLPREAVKRGRSRRRQSVSKTRDSKPANLLSDSTRRFRSASPIKRMDSVGLEYNKLDSYKPSLFTSSLRSSCVAPHFCYECSGRCHSPLLGYYSDRLARLTRCASTSYRCQSHSHCCHW